ncbi:cilia- and flagella-associated protein 54 [Kryptolebias marmoratus]|uniref:cilia- and flagella-associated protein 54 n=1 Tax=Kryptolebias marmoratus TaxID=37003 RepID=UPI000D530B27|nr:cilia- and flagella-associated protein 54 [Kryptolebias marmoratus]
MFKRAVFDNKRRPKVMLRFKYKITLKDIPSGLWPRTSTERMLTGQFDCRAGQFLGILEALWDSNTRPLQMRTPDDAEQHEVVLELLSAGMSILSGVASTGEQSCDDHPSLSPDILTPTSTLMDLVMTGEEKIPIMSAVRFIKLLFRHKQSEAFTELSEEMLRFLPGVEGQLFRKAERELALLHSFNNVLFAERSPPKKNNIKDDKHRSFLMSSELTGLADTLHMSVCGSDPELQPDPDLVLDAVLFLWEKLKAFVQTDQLEASDFTHDLQTIENYGKWVWCLSVLCEVALSYEPATVDCILMAEMIRTLGLQLERTAELFNQTQGSACEGPDHVQLSSSSLFKSNTELLQKVCEAVIKGLEALAKGVATLLPRDSSAVTDSAFMQKFTFAHPWGASSTLSKGESGAGEISMKKEEAKEAEGESDFKGFERCQSTVRFLLARDLHLELEIIHHKASLKLLLLNEVAESELLDQIKKNKVSKAHFLIQKALLVHSSAEPTESSKANKLLEEASVLIEKAEMEEKKLYMTTLKAQKKDVAVPGKDENPPPPPILISRTDRSFTFAPAPYNLEGQVSWYLLCGRVAEGLNLKVRLGDCSIPGTGIMVPVVSGGCLLKVEGLQPNQKYVFAVAAYNSQGKLLGNAIGGTTLQVLASMPVPLLPTWAHLAQVAFQTKQHAIAKRACRALWSHYTTSNPTSNSSQDRFAATGLHIPTLQHSSPHLCQLFLTSIFIETEINIQQESLYSFSDRGKFAWEQEARLAECERMMVAVDLAMCLNDSGTAVQAAVTCYRLLAPLIFHQITCDPVVQVLKKCLVVLEENSFLLKQNWTNNTSESLVHMAACITYYLSKVLRVLKKHKMAAAVMECGRRLLQEVHDAHLEICRIPNQTQANKSVAHLSVSGQMKTNLRLKALRRKDEKRTVSEQTVHTDDEILQPLVSCEDPTELYDLISRSPLQEAYQSVRKLKHKTYFLEFAALLLQRTMEEGHPNLILTWGEIMFQIISRRDEVLGLTTKYLAGNGESKQEGCCPAPKENEIPQSKNIYSYDEIRRKLKRKLPLSLLQCVRTHSEMRMVENLLSMMAYVVRRNKRRIHLRSMCSEERVWRSYLNYCVAQAHFILLYQGLHRMLGGPTQQRYSQFDPFWFSLAHSGVLMRRNSQPHNAALEREGSYDDSKQGEDQKGAVRTDDSVTEESYEEGEGSRQTVEEQTETQKYDAASLLDPVRKAALHLRRAMVLAHRGNHWTTLQHVCQTVWDHSHRITTAVQRAASPVTSDQLSTIFTPLLVLAADLMMDMLNKLELWSLYDRDLTEEELESSLHFSAPLDDSTLVDLRWVRMLVLHALELLHDGGRWESLAHFALLFNSYTRERYASTITPLLVHAQRKLLERISSLGGPAVPQPHHVKTQRRTGEEINYRSYAGCQLLSGWTPYSAKKRPTHKKAARTNATRGYAASLKGSEMQLSMLLVCVPLDVEDTLRCYREALERTPQCLQVLRHSRSLLAQLLAHTQPCFAVQLPRCQSRGLSRSASFSPVIRPTPNVLPRDPCEEDFSAPNAIYGLPISPEYSPTVAAAFSNSIQCLQANGRDSLRVLTLHEMGNLQFYTGNMCAAHSCWSKAVDCAFQRTGVLEKWDGVSFVCDSLRKSVKQAGVWGCLQAAVLTAKIAQFIFTSDISQRTKYCLLSAHLFKCVLCCSTAQPQSDLQYASRSIGDELLPGVDLFSEPRRLDLGTAVTSLNFLCHWLFTTGYYMTLLPTLALYLHFVGRVGRDVQRVAEGKILKVRALTELRLFAEAATEAAELTQGTGVILPCGHHMVNANPQPVKTFSNNQSLLDNLEALEDLVNCDVAAHVCTLYGSTVCIKFDLARVQLLLALADSVHGPPVPESKETHANTTNCAVNPEHHKEDKLDAEEPEKPKVLTFYKREQLSPEKIKFLLLEGASSLLSSAVQQLTSHSCSEVEKVELTVESNLLKANLHLHQGHAALSSKVAASSLTLLQTSPVLVREPGADPKGCSVSDTLHGDCPRAAEAAERIGVFLWLRCRLTLVHSLVANIPENAALFPGKNINEETARVLQEGLDECVRWGDCDVQALLMVEGAELEAQRGRTDNSMTMLQGAVSLLTGRTYMPTGSVMTLARAALLLSDLRGAQSVTLLRLTQKLLKKQLGVFNQADEKICPESSNVYLPYFDMLNKIGLRIDSTLKLGNTKRPVSGGLSQSAIRKNLDQHSHTERDSQSKTHKPE